MGDSFEAVSAAEIMRNFGYWQQKALLKPLAVTHHGRERVMLISTETYESLCEPAANADQPTSSHLDAVRAHMAEGLTIIDHDFIVRDVSDTALAWINATREEVIGAPLGAPGGAPINPLHKSMLSRVMRTGESLTYDFVSAERAGNTLHVRTFPHGDMVGSIYTDVSEYVALNVADHIRKAALAGLDELGVVAMVELDSDNRIASASDAFDQMAGTPVAALLGSAFQDLVSAQDRPALLACIGAALRSNKVQSLNVSLNFQGRAPMATQMSISPLDNPGAAPSVTIALAAAPEGCPA